MGVSARPALYAEQAKTEDICPLGSNKRADMQPNDEPIPTSNPTPEPPPNGPAKVSTDNKKERFKLDYGGEIVFQAGVKLIRDDKSTSLRDAVARLFVVSKFDGWDVVTQTIRIAAVGSLPGDILTIDGHCPIIDDTVVTEILCDEAQLPCVYCASHDWLLSIDPGPTTTLAVEDVPVKGTADVTAQRVTVAATGPEIILRFRPYYRQRHRQE